MYLRYHSNRQNPRLSSRVISAGLHASLPRVPIYWRSCGLQPQNSLLAVQALSAPWRQYGQMDELLLNTRTLSSTLIAFRDLVEYYVVSPDWHATGTRSQLRRSASGGDMFLSALCQDLDDICTYCGQADDRKHWDDSAKSDIRHVLTCLSNLITPTKPSEVSNLSLLT